MNVANKDHVFFNFLENIPVEDKKLMLRAMSELEVMENCCSEEEYRMITGEEMPADFPSYRPDKAEDVQPSMDHEVSSESLKKRLAGIKKEFGEKPSMERLRALATNTLPRPEKPEVEITINIGQLREKADKLQKS
jgi:hypothetical protein